MERARWSGLHGARRLSMKAAHEAPVDCPRQLLMPHAAATGGSCPIWLALPMLPGLAWGPPPPGAPNSPTKVFALQQANAPAGRSITSALLASQSRCGGPERPPPAKNRQVPIFLRSPASKPPSCSSRASSGLQLDLQHQLERALAPPSDQSRMTAAATQGELIRMRRLRAVQQQQREGATC